MKRKEFLQKSVVAGLGLSILPLSGFKHLLSPNFIHVGLPLPVIHGIHGQYNPDMNFCASLATKDIMGFSKDIFQSDSDQIIHRIQMNLDGDNIAFTKRGDELFYCIDGKADKMYSNSTFEVLSNKSSYKISAVRLSQFEKIDIPVKKYSFVFSMNDGVYFDGKMLGSDSGVLIKKDFNAKVISEKEDVLLFISWD